MAVVWLIAYTNGHAAQIRYLDLWREATGELSPELTIGTSAFWLPRHGPQKSHVFDLSNQIEQSSGLETG